MQQCDGSASAGCQARDVARLFCDSSAPGNDVRLVDADVSLVKVAPLRRGQINISRHRIFSKCVLGQRRFLEEVSDKYFATHVFFKMCP